MKKVVIICIDGCDPKYISETLPNLRRFKQSIGFGVIPTITNVNSVSIITGTYPKDHGITSNFYYDRELDKAVYMESADSILVENIFEKAAKRKLRSTLITAKDKLRTLLSKGTDLSFSAEKPVSWIVEKVGFPPDIYSIEVNEWLFRSLLEVLESFDPDLSLLMTTDYAMHKFPPGSDLANRNMSTIDELVGILIDYVESKRYSDDFLICLTADHGMSEKRRGIDLEKLLKEEGICVRFIPIIKDRYVEHHQNLGGASYLYLKESVERALEVLSDVEGIEEALSRSEAVELYNLHPDRIGDILVLGEEDVVFGRGRDVLFDVNLRSHGSLHEREVPIFIYDESFELKENKDVGNIALEWLNAKA